MDKQLNVRIINRIDTYANWIANDPVPMNGELCIATVAAETGAVASEPAVIIKVGDGTNKYSALPILSGMAADVYAWAKTPQKPTYNANEVTGIDAYIADYVEEQMGISVDTDTQYQIVKVDDYNYKLQFKGKTDEAWADAPNGTITIPVYDDSKITGDIEAIKGLIGETAVATQIANAIAALDLANTYEAKGAAAQALTDAKKYVDDNKKDYTVTVAESTPEGYAKAYQIQQASTGLDVTINIPKDMVVSSGTVETKTEAGDWGEAGVYLVLTLANATNDKVYINAGSLIEYVTSGSAADDQIVVSISADHKVTATLSAGSVTKEQLNEEVRTALDNANGAVKEVTTGTANGTLAVDGTDVPVFGLKSAAYTDSSEYDKSGAATTAETNAKQYADEKVAALNVEDAAVEKQFVTAVSETAGKVSVTRAAVADIALTGNIADLIQTEGDVIIFNCGDSTK